MRKSTLVCLNAEAGALHIEVGPLSGLPSFVKTLRVQGRDWQHTVLGSNTRQRSVRFATPIEEGPWVWAAVGFEDDDDIDLSGLTLQPLEEDRPHVFRIDATGVGRWVAGDSLAPRERYRVLVPEALWVGDASPQSAATLGRWHLWEVDVDQLDPPEVKCLRQLRITIPEGAARLDWVLESPVQWKSNAAGESYPAFISGSDPIVLVDRLNGRCRRISSTLSSRAVGQSDAATSIGVRGTGPTV